MESVVSKSDVGILFVHGIGSQLKGTQVVPLVKAVQRTLVDGDIVPEGEAAFTVDVRSVTLTGAEPAQALIDVGRTASDVRASKWLIAESLWSESFIPPTLTETLSWLAFTAPLVLTSRAIEGIQGSFRALKSDVSTFWKFLAYLIWVPLALPLGVLTILAVALLTLLRGLIPFAWAKNLIAKLELALTNVVGDSYVYSTDSVNSVAMETAVGRDIDWLAERSKKLIIVAHSQGASVAAGALARRKKIDAFVTLGAGIGQLAWLKRVNASKWTGAIVLLTWAIVLGIGSVVIGAIVRAVGGDFLLISLIVGLGGIAFVPQLIVEFGLPSVHSTRAKLAPADKQPSPAVVWEDLWATSDPVPGGAATEREYNGVESFAVWNKGDLLRDHSGYLANGAEVVSRIVRLALTFSRVAVRGEVATRLSETLPISAGLRRRRGGWIERLRIVLAAALVALVLRQWEEVSTIGPYLLERLSALGLKVVEQIPYTTIPTAAVVSVVVMILIFLAAYLVGAALALAWQGVESPHTVREQLRADHGFGSRAAHIAFFSYFWLLVAVLVLFISVPVADLGAVGTVTTVLLTAVGLSALAHYFLTLPFFAWSHEASKVSWIKASTKESRRRAYWRVFPFTAVAAAAIVAASMLLDDASYLGWAALAFVVVFYVAMALSLRFVGPERAHAPRVRRSFMYFPQPPTGSTPLWIIAVFGELIILGLQVLAHLRFFEFSMEAQGNAFLFVVILGFAGTIGFVFWLDDLSGLSGPGGSRWYILNWGLVITSLALSVTFFVRLAQAYGS